MTMEDFSEHPDEPLSSLLCNKCSNLVEFVMDHDRYPYWCQGCERRLSSGDVRLDPERKQLTIGVD